MEFMIAIFLLLNAHFGETTGEQLAYRTAYVQTGALPPKPWQLKTIHRAPLER